jgi:hypothetical protein
MSGATRPIHNLRRDGMIRRDAAAALLGPIAGAAELAQHTDEG